MHSKVFPTVGNTYFKCTRSKKMAVQSFCFVVGSALSPLHKGSLCFPFLLTNFHSLPPYVYKYTHHISTVGIRREFRQRSRRACAERSGYLRDRDRSNKDPGHHRTVLTPNRYFHSHYTWRRTQRSKLIRTHTPAETNCTGFRHVHKLYIYISTCLYSVAMRKTTLPRKRKWNDLARTPRQFRYTYCKKTLLIKYLK